MKYLFALLFLALGAGVAHAEVTLSDIKNALTTRPSISVGITEKFNHLAPGPLTRDKENLWLGGRVTMPMGSHFELVVGGERIAATEPVYSGNVGLWIRF